MLELVRAATMYDAGPPVTRSWMLAGFCSADLASWPFAQRSLSLLLTHARASLPPFHTQPCSAVTVCLLQVPEPLDTP